MPAIHVRPLIEADYNAVFTVARSLAAWFRPIDQMALAIDLRMHEGFVAEREREPAPIGFLTFHVLDETTAELSWLGVRLEYQGEGVGSRLLSALEDELKRRGIGRVQVGTVAEESEEPAFAATRHFYLSHGFRQIKHERDFYSRGRHRTLLEKELGQHTMDHGGNTVDNMVVQLRASKSEFRDVVNAVLDAGVEDKALPDNPDWTVRGIIAHLETSEKAMQTMAQIMVAKEGYDFKPYDRDEINQERIDRRADTPLDEIVDSWLATRDEMIAFAAGLSDEELAYDGTEPYWGDMTTRTVFEVAVEHTREHLDNVRAALEAAAG